MQSERFASLFFLCKRQHTVRFFLIFAPENIEKINYFKTAS
ncbi:Uncharacterised protein [Bacteroides heparinolyticus]|uniref:Uncharacterized protein n=1 Tax=Prevotella heparinolytica TaxID=28113 RepID=A0A449I4D0_9BACE|nr:Uncharacterised protein [Bacteroides heparinolyticus]